MDFDVIVVGAGPAGSSAAAWLASAGLDVAVMDRAHFPRDKCCGDGLTSPAIAELDRLGLDRSTVASWTEIRNVHLRSPLGTTARLAFPSDGRTYAATATRYELDDALVDIARSRGAKVMEGVALLGASTDEHGAVVETSTGCSWRARYLVGADGAFSALRSQLSADKQGARRPLPRLHALRQYFEGAPEEVSRTLLTAFTSDLRPGYAWAFPVGDKVNAGIMVNREHYGSTGRLGRSWRHALDTELASFLGPSASPTSPVSAWPIPSELPIEALAVGRALFVGDAAGASDYLTGEGIGQAVLTGRLAANALVARSDAPEQVAAHYRSAVSRHFRTDRLVNAALVEVLSHRRPTDRAVRTLLAMPMLQGPFLRWMFEDIPRGRFLDVRGWKAARMALGAGPFGRR